MNRIGTHDVFVSYSTRDKPIADAACAVIEARKLRCWIAPRDVLPGVPYAESLDEAIGGSRVMVLILSAGANESGQVMREVESAVSLGLPVVPIRIEDIQPSRSLHYFLRSIHWLDALTPPIERHLQRLAETVELLLSRSRVATRVVPGEPPPAEAPGAVGDETGAGAPTRSRRRRPAVAVAGVVLLAAVGIVAALAWPSRGPRGEAEVARLERTLAEAVRQLRQETRSIESGLVRLQGLYTKSQEEFEQKLAALARNPGRSEEDLDRIGREGQARAESLRAELADLDRRLAELDDRETGLEKLEHDRDQAAKFFAQAHEGLSPREAEIDRQLEVLKAQRKALESQQDEFTKYIGEGIKVTFANRYA
jgi:hypothetical protein